MRVKIRKIIGEGNMAGNVYRIEMISGDYAVLRSKDNENTVALALLPEDINEGDHVRFELISYVRCDADGNTD